MNIWPFRRSSPPRAPPRGPPFDLSAPLCRFTDRDVFTLGDLCQSVFITGEIGSGKTSGPLALIVKSALNCGCGFLHLCAKPGAHEWLAKLCRQTGREKDLVRFAPGERNAAGELWSLDVLDVELNARGGGVTTAVELLTSLVEMSGREGGQGENKYWNDAATKYMRACVQIVHTATGHCSISDIEACLSSAPKSRADAESKAFEADSACLQWVARAKAKLIAGLLTPDQARDLAYACTLLCREWWQTSDKTRSVVYSVVTNTTSRFVTGPLAGLVSSGRTTLPPTAPADGKVVSVDLPALLYQSDGIQAGVLMKQVVSRATLRRAVTPGMRPVVVCADEGHLYCDPVRDLMSATVGRESRLVSLVATQNLPSLFEHAGGGDRGRQAMLGWVACHATKIACSNGCAETNTFYSEMFGHERKLFYSFGSQNEPYDLVDDVLGVPPRTSANASQQWMPCVAPHEFASGLSKGGKANGCVVTAYVFTGGRRWSSGRPFLKASFDQHF